MANEEVYYRVDSNSNVIHARLLTSNQARILKAGKFTSNDNDSNENILPVVGSATVDFSKNINTIEFNDAGTQVVTIVYETDPGTDESRVIRFNNTKAQWDAFERHLGKVQAWKFRKAWLADTIHQEKFRANNLNTSRRTILNKNNADDEDLKRRLNTYVWYLGIRYEYIMSGDSTWENAFYTVEGVGFDGWYEAHQANTWYSTLITNQTSSTATNTATRLAYLTNLTNNIGGLGTAGRRIAQSFNTEAKYKWVGDGNSENLLIP